MALRRQLRRLLLVLLAMAGLLGCHAVDFYEPSLQRPAPPENDIPDAVTETQPADCKTYVDWMLREIKAIFSLPKAGLRDLDPPVF